MRHSPYHFRISDTASRIFFIHFALFALCILAVSCGREEMIRPPDDSNTVTITFHANHSLFAQQTISESQINEAQALVFIYNGSEYTYGYSAQPTIISEAENGGVNFNLTVYTERNPVKIYIVANANNAITANYPHVGETETAVKSRLTKGFTSGGMNTNFAMWGEYLLPSGISTSIYNAVISLKVLRAIARIDITTDEVESIFSMTSVQAFRANNLLQIVPNSYTGDLLVSNPSIPTASTSTVNTIPISTTGSSSISQLYLPESEAPLPANQVSDATCVIVGGRYNGSSDITYYRLDFNPPIADYPLGQILRNHQYTFNITQITSAGWPTPEEAANNAPANIEVSVEDWTDANVDVELGGSNYFRISSRTISVGNTSGSLGYTFVSTSVTDYTIEWSDAQGTPSTPSNTSISNGTFTVTRGVNIISVEALSDNPSGDGPREQYVLIVAKRARILIKINQLAG